MDQKTADSLFNCMLDRIEDGETIEQAAEAVAPDFGLTTEEAVEFWLRANGAK